MEEMDRSLKRSIINEDQNKNDLLMNYYKRLKLNHCNTGIGTNDSNNNNKYDDITTKSTRDNEFIELNKSNFKYFNSNNNNNTSNDYNNIDYFNYLSVELLVKIFNYCDPFYTPLIFICKNWYYVITENQVSLWKELKISINSNNKPILYSPSKNAILSYFNCGYYKSLIKFSINSIDFKPIKNNNSSISSNNSIINSPNRNKRNQNNNFYLQQQQQFKQNYLQQNNLNPQQQQDININIPIDYKFFKSLINLLCNNNLNLKYIDIILPINHKQLKNIVSQCKNLKDLSFNGLYINDDELKDIFTSGGSSVDKLERLKNLSVMVVGQFSEEFKQKKHQNGIKHSSITPASLYSISKMKQLKSLKFSLLPHYGNFKSIAEQHTDTIPMQQIPNTGGNSTTLVSGDESEWCTATLGNLVSLSKLEISSCILSGTVLSDLINNGFDSLSSLVLYRVGSLSSLKFVSHSLKSIQLSCLSVLEYIEITCSVLDSFSIEGCESLQSTLIFAPNMQSLSFESCSGRLNLLQADSLQVLSLFECADLTQSSLEHLIDSLPSLEELYIYLQQIKNLRLVSISLRKLDLEAWSGILSCILDCPSLEELKASESTIETLYLKGNNLSNIELDFCDSLRTVIIDILSCYHFSFTQNHPFKGFINLPDLNENHYISSQKRKNPKDVFDDNDQENNQDDEENRINRSYFLSTNLFIQSQNFIQNCIILSSNIIGNLSTKVIGSLSIEEKSQNTFIYNISKICKYSIYKEITNCIGKSPKFVPIQQQLIYQPQQNYQQQSFDVYDFTPSPLKFNNINNFNYNNNRTSLNQFAKNTFNISNYDKNNNNISKDNNTFEFLDEYGGNSRLFNGFKKYS